MYIMVFGVKALLALSRYLYNVCHDMEALPQLNPCGATFGDSNWLLNPTVVM